MTVVTENHVKCVVEVVLALPERQTKRQVQVPDGMGARQVLLRAEAQGLGCARAGLDPAAVPLGVYGVRIDDDHVLADGDRLEVYRPLTQDPMTRRRQRAQQV